MITSENACFMITVSIKKMSALVISSFGRTLVSYMLLFSTDKKHDSLYKHNFKTTYHNHYNKSCLYFLHVVPDRGRYIHVNTGTYVQATGIHVHASLSI